MRIVAGQFKNRKLLSPKGSATRPTLERLREAFFNICQQEVIDSSFLDLFAGSGAMGFEAMSRGAKTVMMIDHNRECVRTMHQNQEHLGIRSGLQIVQGDVFKMCSKLSENDHKFDIIFADPPYEQGFELKTLELMDQLNLLAKGGSFFIESSSKIHFEEHPLRTLELIEQRKMGRLTTLFRYQKRDLN